MTTRSDWLPGTREGILAMAKEWTGVCAANAAAWNIPQSARTGIEQLAADAGTKLETAKNETTRTPVATAQCSESFEKLSAGMRDFKRRYFLDPPLAPSDFIALGLKPRDTTPTPSGPPTAQTTIETYLVGRHELGVKIVYLTGNPADSANKGYRIWYSVLAQGAASTDAPPPPANPEDLKRSFYTKRKKDVIAFEFTDSGKTVYMAVQIENEGRKGPWGPLVSALIP